MTKIVAVVSAAVALAPFGFSSLVARGGSAATDDASTLPVAPATTITIPVPVATTAAPTTSVPVRVAISVTPNVSVRGADSQDRTHLEDALEAFSANGLQLPDLDVRFYDGTSECSGHKGLFQRSFIPWRLLICSDLPFVPTHEIAHAWEAANLTDADRDRYVEARGLTTWDDTDAEWDDRGVEDVAFMIQQNLTATSPALTSPTWIERTAAYELATGQPSPLYTDS